MSIFKTREKRKSIIATSIIMSALLLSFVFVTVMGELEEEEEAGIAINFGNTATGSGPVETAQTTKVTPQANPTPSESTPFTQTAEDVLTQDNPDTPVVNTQPEVKDPKPTETKPEPKPVTKPVVKPEPKPSSDVLEALTGVSGAEAVDGESENGEGEDGTPGNAGAIDGDPYSNTRYGAPGTGQGGTKYGLNGRGKVGSSQVVQECDQEGTVIVEIQVNQKGEVKRAIPGKKGTTNNIQCLLDAAKATAMTYRFTPAAKAAAIQIGYVEVIFKVGE